MKNRPLLEGPAPDSLRRKNGESELLARPQYIEVPASPVIEEPGSSLLLEYFDIIRRHKGTLILIAFLGFLASILLTLPQTPIYQARASLEIQSINDDFLNMRDMSPTANGGGSYPPQYDLQTQVKILQSESVLERVIGKLHLEQKLTAGNHRGRLSAWRNALGLPQWRTDSPREEVLRLITKNLKVSTEASTRLVDIRYDSKDPQLAADFLNALTTEFIQQNIEARWKTTQQTGDWLTHQMEDVRIKLEKIRRRVTKLCSRLRPTVHFGKGGFAAYRGQYRRRKTAAASGGALQGARRACRQAIGIRVGRQRSPPVPPCGAR